ncbi:hypothetical protein SETIT_3G305300v2 [Setaria italica]|uniref:Uncharacterized protein n=1 Tax=Setaria italica TaxID=4555 RepID=A0A368QL03_SETIT|nr:hypothetical protein SETIT_3G305300v2 [Setaria italica]
MSPYSTSLHLSSRLQSKPHANPSSLSSRQRRRRRRKEKQDDLRRELTPLPLLPQPEGRRLRQEENGRAKAQGAEAQGQREQACDERIIVAAESCDSCCLHTAT